MKLYALDVIPVGHVVIYENGVEVAFGHLTSLRDVPADEAENTEIVINPADVEAFKAQWFEPKGRLN